MLTWSCSIIWTRAVHSKLMVFSYFYMNMIYIPAKYISLQGQAIDNNIIYIAFTIIFSASL